MKLYIIKILGVEKLLLRDSNVKRMLLRLWRLKNEDADIIKQSLYGKNFIEASYALTWKQIFVFTLVVVAFAWATYFLLVLTKEHCWLRC